MKLLILDGVDELLQSSFAEFQQLARHLFLTALRLKPVSQVWIPIEEYKNLKDLFVILWATLAVGFFFQVVQRLFAPIFASLAGLKYSRSLQRKWNATVKEFVFYTGSFLLGISNGLFAYVRGSAVTKACCRCRLVLPLSIQGNAGEQEWFTQWFTAFGTTKVTQIIWPSSTNDNPLWTMEIKAAYMIETAWYLSSIMLLIFVDARKKDFLEMVVHHIVTIVLLVVSVQVKHVKIGCIIYMLHNISDVFLHSAKLVNYLDYKKAADVLFGTFVIVFFITRLVLYPLFVLNTCVREGLYYEGFLPWPEDETPRMEHSRHEWALVALLSALIPIHVYWFGLIVRMIIRMIVTKSSVENDIRSDDEDEAEYDEEDKSDAQDVPAKATSTGNDVGGNVRRRR